MKQREQVLELTKKFIKDYKELVGEKEFHYSFGYELPFALGELMPVTEDDKFYDPLIGLGFVNEIIKTTFEKRLDGLDKKVESLIKQNFGKPLEENDMFIQNWKEEFVEVEDIKHVKGKITFFKTKARQVCFTVKNNKNGKQYQIVCLFHVKSESLKQIMFKGVNNRTFLSLHVGNNYDIKSHIISTYIKCHSIDYGHIKDINNCITTFLFLAQG